ncbi:MAG: hypothetical protein WDW38_010162 [Sanguina aurantia]
MHFVIVKQSLVSANDSHFSGGKHVIHQMAVSLATQGHRVSLLSVSTRGEVMVAAVHQGFLSRLRTTQQGVVEWEADGVSHYVVCEQLREQQPPTQHASPSLVHSDSLIDRALHELVVNVMRSKSVPRSTQPNPGPTDSTSHALSSSVSDRAWLILDADDLQKTRPPPPQQQPSTDHCPQGAPASPSSPAHPPPASLFETLALSLPGQVLALVQNIYFLPFGPSGTTPSSPGLIAAWASLAGVVAVSDFVAGYLHRWGNCSWLPQASSTPSSCDGPGVTVEEVPSSDCSCAQVKLHETLHGGPHQQPPSPITGDKMLDTPTPGSSGADTQLAAAASPSEPSAQAAHGRPSVMVIHLCAWGVFGAAPYPDFGSRVARRLSSAGPLPQASSIGAGTATGMARGQVPSLRDSPVGVDPVSICAAGAHPTDATGGSAVAAADGAGRGAVSPGPGGSSQGGAAGRGRGGEWTRPVIGLMKLLPEKGSSVVLELARRLPEYDFLAVTGEPGARLGVRKFGSHGTGELEAGRWL